MAITYNVAVSIVDLIEADTPEEAISILTARMLALGLHSAGLDVLEDSGTAFVSDVDVDGNLQEA